MDLLQKIRTLPLQPGVYLYKNAEGEVIYVGKAKNLRARVRSYFQEGVAEANAKTGSLLREAVDVEYIVVANNKEALALENNLIKQKKPRFNILLRDDKTYPYIKLTLGERFPRVYVTRRLRKDGSIYYGPYFPGNLAYRIVDLIHRSFLVPSCKVDLTRYHLRPCLQYYIKRCLGPCVQDLTTPQAYQEAVRDVQLLLEGRQTDLAKSLRGRMEQAARDQEYERAARYRDMISTVSQLQEKQRIAAAEGDDMDVFGYHYENDMLAVNVFHMRGGKILDRREFFWEELPEIAFPQEEFAAEAVEAPNKTGGLKAPAPALSENEHAATSKSSAAPAANENSPVRSEAIPRSGRAEEPVPGGSPKNSGALAPVNFAPGPFFSALMKQIYIDQQYVPRDILSPVDFEDRPELEELLAEKRGSRMEILVPQRGEKRSLIDLAAQNAKQSFDQRFRVMKPQAKAVQEALQDALGLPDLPKRIECFDISHIQGAETVASMVVWQDGRMNKSEYRKFIVRTVTGVDDFASMREVVTRRYKRLRDENASFPSLILVDGGLGQLHAAAQALDELGITNQPLAAIAKKEEIIYVFGQEDDPIVLDRHSPVLHLVQMVRDESHRFAVTFHRKRRQMRDRKSELLEIPGVGERTRQRLLQHFGSVRAVQQADAAALSAVLTKPQTEAVLRHFQKSTDRADVG
ncbi:MAG TPA: excinuclease ABC subunit UvrC [Candidatus Angelobacter sp.]|nr:excinuclease ABC subunit UvrC [Candidatus Angelobacter sp.]